MSIPHLVTCTSTGRLVLEIHIENLEKKYSPSRGTWREISNKGAILNIHFYSASPAPEICAGVTGIRSTARALTYICDYVLAEQEGTWHQTNVTGYSFQQM